MNSTIADLYSLVLFKNLQETFLKELLILNDKINYDENFKNELDNNHNTNCLKEVLSQNIYDTFISFLDTQNEPYISDLIEDYLKYVYKQEHIEFGTIYSVSQIAKDKLKIIEENFTKKLNVNVKLQNKIDKSLIAGFKVVFEGHLYDNSYKNKLAQLKNKLIEDPSLINDVSNINIADICIENNDNTGHIISMSDGIVVIDGLNKAKSGELLNIANSKAMVMNLYKDHLDAVLLNNDSSIKSGDKVYSTGKVIEIGVGDCLLGRVIDALGNPIDNKGSLSYSTYSPIEKAAPAIIDRSFVNEPLQTGIMVIDSLIPIGKGQRELIIGDRQTGKTSIAIDTIINQRNKNVKCVYVAIGQKNSTVAHLVDKLKEKEALEYTTVVVASASDSCALQYIAPYSACSIAEYWMEKGEDVLIIYDDLSKHAVAYRTLSLLLKRPPGREAYPGDVFYLHSRLLERSGKLSAKLKGGSLTALPIIETLSGDISAYIPTNVISITDGQIFLQSELFNSGIRPAVDSGLSVSRVGSAAQLKTMKKVSASLKLDLAQYQEVADFTQFGSDLDAGTIKIINHGQHLKELLIQPQYQTLTIPKQIILLLSSNLGYLDDFDLALVKKYKSELLRFVENNYHDLLEELDNSDELNKELMDKINLVISIFSKEFLELNTHE